jgi:DNA gyrase/topoisomerase IV subunit A
VNREDKTKTILVVSEKGIGKRTNLDEYNEETKAWEEIYRITNRGGKGVKTLNISEKTGKLIGFLAVDETDLVLVECKSRLSKDDVDEFLEKLSRFKEAFPHYKNYQAYGAVAGIEINEGIDRYAYRQGLFVIKTAGNMVKIVNSDNFQPKIW